jgi:hypothetical protein
VGAVNPYSFIKQLTGEPLQSENGNLETSDTIHDPNACLKT